jgi:hypothetical protein
MTRISLPPLIATWKSPSTEKNTLGGFFAYAGQKLAGHVGLFVMYRERCVWNLQ